MRIIYGLLTLSIKSSWSTLVNRFPIECIPLSQHNCYLSKNWTTSDYLTLQTFFIIMSLKFVNTSSSHLLLACLTKVFFVRTNLLIVEYELTECPSPPKETCWLYQGTRKPTSMCQQQRDVEDDHNKAAPFARTSFPQSYSIDVNDLRKQSRYNKNQPRLC